MEYFKSEQELKDIIQGFENCTTPATDFPHRSHLVLASWYLDGATVSVALDKMRTCILTFLKHYGINGKYNETITLFWITVVKNFLDTLPGELTLLERTNAVIEALNDSNLMFEYYSRDLLWSEKAMREWVDPDVKSLE